MAQGAYDHPSYLTRQLLPLGVTIAGVGTTMRRVFPATMRIRNIAAVAQVAGTGASWPITVQAGTASIGALALGSAAPVGATATSGDLNFVLPALTALNFNVGTEATGVAAITVEAHLDPSATWS